MMKKIFSMAALALLMTACGNDIDEPQAQQQPANLDGMITITAKLAPKSEAGTRAVTPGTDSNSKDIIKVTWAADEHLAILYEVSGVKKMADATITAVDDKGVATITFAVESGTADETPCTIVYPLAAAKDDYSGVKDAATLLANQDGTLSANLDVRVGAGTISTSKPSLGVTTQPAAQFAIFKFTTKNSDGTANIDVRPLIINIGSQNFVITPASATNVLYVALPAVSSQTVNFLATSSDGETKYSCSKAGVSFTASNYYQSILKMNPSVLPGKFTINASGDKVYFSQGNLQAVCTSADDDGNTQESWTWRFATNQWDYVGNATANNAINGNGSVSAAGSVDLFGWSTTATYYGIHNSEEDNPYNSGDFVDWGTLAITNGGNTANSGWRTPTGAEWDYLFNTRSGGTVNGTENARYTYAVINTGSSTVNGIILFPDGVTIAADEAEPWGRFNNTPTSNNWANSTKCTTTQWTVLAAKGCVFLSTAGYRSGTSVSRTGTDGFYWSSSPVTSDYAFRVGFYIDGLYPQSNGFRSSAYSVRLVRTAE